MMFGGRGGRRESGQGGTYLAEQRNIGAGKYEIRGEDKCRNVELKSGEEKQVRRRSAFSETMQTLNRLSSSYRRCYWKSGSEMLFPILFGHLTFASHRCWTVYVKKAIFLAAEAWRRKYGTSVKHAAMLAGAAAVRTHVYA